MTRARRAGRPFFGLIECVVVESPAAFEFDGAVSREHATAIWTWMTRDLAPDLVDPGTPDGDFARQALDALMPELLGRTRQAVAAAATSYEAERRLKTQVGGEIVYGRLPMVLNALKCRNLLGKAQAFGRASNGMQDDAGLAVALQSMPLNDQAVAALLMMAAVGQVANPGKLITAVIRIAGSAQEASIQRAGFKPLVDAMLAHAQNQIHALAHSGPYADIDLTCRAIDRFHRLVRAVNGYVELSRASHWSTIVSALTKAVSERVEPRLRDVAGNLNMALRRGREGSDRLDSEQILVALNGVYVLAAVRDARDSLGVNALFDQAWNQVGQALEIHIQRGLDILRQNPGDMVTSARLEAAIKMAELRFNPDYAETLRRAKDSAERLRSA
ncbi:MAG: hypothetical protein EOP19_00355 [Hyphomicrobiales bacterium]|nr:MAG: hypothetical protein EOP19_00355 [Hyphomicrobiales bacterium]